MLCAVADKDVQCLEILSLSLGAAGQAMPPKGSTLDDKIQQRVQALKARGTSKYTPEVRVFIL